MVGSKRPMRGQRVVVKNTFLEVTPARCTFEDIPCSKSAPSTLSLSELVERERRKEAAALIKQKPTSWLSGKEASSFIKLLAPPFECPSCESLFPSDSATPSFPSTPASDLSGASSPGSLSPTTMHSLKDSLTASADTSPSPSPPPTATGAASASASAPSLAGQAAPKKVAASASASASAAASASPSSTPSQKGHYANTAASKELKKLLGVGGSEQTEGRQQQEEEKKGWELDLAKVGGGEDKRTTLMVKNIPNKYTQRMLLDTLRPYRGTFDFFYLPIDFKNKCNVGYAFINFIKPEWLVPFYRAFNGKKWEMFNSEKVCSITYARIQGKQAMINHFQNSRLMAEDRKCRPLIFHSDGPNAGEEEEFPVGQNVQRFLHRNSRTSDWHNSNSGGAGHPTTNAPNGAAAAGSSSSAHTLRVQQRHEQRLADENWRSSRR